MHFIRATYLSGKSKQVRIRRSGFKTNLFSFFSFFSFLEWDDFFNQCPCLGRVSFPLPWRFVPLARVRRQHFLLRSLGPFFLPPFRPPRLCHPVSFPLLLVAVPVWVWVWACSRWCSKCPLRTTIGKERDEND